MGKVLVTGGTGYIGSHVVASLIENNYEPIIIDNFSNSSPRVLDNLCKLTNRQIDFYCIDITDRSELKKVFVEQEIEAVVHLAALKSVSESLHRPLDYYRTNVLGTVNLLGLMSQYSIELLIFSSSAAVYGLQEADMCREDTQLQPTSTYGHTKVVCEQIIEHLPGLKAISLRYFNPVGAHPSGLLGEDSCLNLLPLVAQIALGKRAGPLLIYGVDYNTEDGTAIRDYPHVVDIAHGHLQALAFLKTKSGCGQWTYNLGTGCGHSVLQVVQTFTKVTGLNLNLEFSDRRPGDVPFLVANIHKATADFNWSIQFSLEDACRHLVHYYQQNK